MALDAGLASFVGQPMHALRRATLFGCVHRRLRMTVAALARVRGLHRRPYVIGHRQPLRFEFFRRVDRSHDLVEQLVGGLNLSDQFVVPLLGNVTIRTRGANTRPVGEMDGLLQLLVHGAAHFVAGDAERLRIRQFH